MALRAQEYPQELVEILVIDGGRRSHTPNRRTLWLSRTRQSTSRPGHGKSHRIAGGDSDYLMHVDSDEVLLDRSALSKTG